MDPISIITLAASTTKAAYTVSTQLYLFVNAVKNVDESLKSLTSELSGLRRSLDATSVALQNPLVRSEKAAAPENTPIWAAVAGALDDCRHTLVEFEKQVSPHQQREAKRGIFKRSVTVWKLNLSKGEINVIRDQIQTHTGSLQVALQTLNILVSGLGPAQAAGDISQNIATLTEALTRVHQGRHEGIAHYAQVEKTAQAVLTNAPELLKTGVLAAGTAESQTAATVAYNDIIKRFDASIYLSRQVSGLTAPPSYTASSSSLSNEGETPKDTPDDSDFSDSEDELELSLARELFLRGRDCVQSRKFREAENYIRDAFGHIPDVSKMDDDFDADEGRIELALCCLYQQKVQEAELILQLLIQGEDAIDEKSLRVHHILATVYLCLFDFNSALEHCTAAVRGRRRLFGKSDERYLSSLQLLALVYHVNGDFVSSAAYAKKLPSDKAPLPENKYVLDLFHGYLPQEQLRMSLEDKRCALNELALAKRIARQRDLRADEQQNASAPPLINTHPDLRSLDVNETLKWFVSETKPRDNKPLVTKFLLSRGASPEGTLGSLPLHNVALKGHHEVVRVLLEAGSEVDSRDKDGHTPLHWTTIWGYEQAARALLEHGADANATDNDGSTPLMDASYKGHVSTMDALLSAGADVGMTNKRGRTALIEALRNSQLEAARRLIESGAAVNGAFDDGETPLHIAVGLRSVPLVRLLMEKGALINKRDDTDRTPLFRVAPSGSPEMIKLLVEHGANVNALDEKDATVMTKCCEWDSADLLQTLLDLGADLNTGSKDTFPGVVATTQRSGKCLAIIGKYPGTIVSVTPAKHGKLKFTDNTGASWVARRYLANLEALCNMKRSRSQVQSVTPRCENPCNADSGRD